ncbi:Receptor-like protein EIX2 [Linum grandiflorum]
MTLTSAAAILCCWFFFSAITTFTFCHGGTLENPSCQPTERQALLELKTSLVDSSDWLNSWSVHGDCCKWSGVVCNNVTGHVIELHLGAADLPESTYFTGEISPSLAKLKQLIYLDLSSNSFSEIPIPEFIGSLSNLRLLDLSGAGFSGAIPYNQFGNLSKLRYLNLQGNPGANLYLENLDWVSSLSYLKFLDLSYVDLSVVKNWLTVLNKVPSLEELHLSNCQLPSIPTSLRKVNLSSLSLLDLSYNNFNDPLFPSWTFYLHSLTSLDLANNRFRGPIPEGLRNMSLLTQLDLSWNHFTSLEPNCFLGLTHMQVLSIAQNELKGEIFSSAMQNMTSLIDLDLSSNQLESAVGIPQYFRNFCSLRVITLSGVELRQEVGEALRILSACPADSLETIRMSDCKLFGNMTNIPFQNFQKLDTLSLSRNSISGPVPLSVTDLVSLRSLELFSNKLIGPLPWSLGTLSNLESIDISENSLEGDVAESHFQNITKLWLFQASGNQLTLRVGPRWNPPPQIEILGMGFWHLGPNFPVWIRSLKLLTQLNMSSAGISSKIPSWLFFNSHFYSIDMSSNLLNGPLPYIYPFMSVLDLSNNSLSGSLSKFLCYKPDEEKTMQVMNLGANEFSGEIPDCWTSWKYLEAIKLSSNKFRGSIPRSLGTLSFLQSIHLRNNNLSGEIPQSFANITKLVALDFRENKFDGSIPEELCLLKSLRILDLADNNLTGYIPRCVNNFTAMFVRSIDLSKNKLVGEIPEEMTKLGGLQSLNLSDNFLTGVIPRDIGSMGALESIDLSLNQLSGEIPPSISSMTFLSFINISSNRLTGRIPLSTQLQSLDSSSFAGNSDLCGSPLAKNCTTVDSNGDGREEPEDDGNDPEIKWFYVSLTLGFVLGFWGAVGSLVLNNQWRIGYFRFMDRLWDRLRCRL